MVMHTLSSEFTLLRVVNGEAVSAHNLGVTNGFVKPKLGERQPPLFYLVFRRCDHNDTQIFVSSYVVLVPRPVIHPLSSPSNMFCVTSLDPDTLPSVATLLMDVMFYSGG